MANNGYINHAYLEKVATQVSGRDIEQEIMASKNNYISMVKFEHSVTISKCAIRQSAMNENEKKDDNSIEDDIVFTEDKKKHRETW